MNEHYKGYTIKIEHDQDAESPRDWDNVSKMVFSHSRFDFPNDAGISFDDFHGWDEIALDLINNHGAKYIMHVYMYEHGQIAFKTAPFSDPWDSGKLGLIYITAEGIAELGDQTDEGIEAALNGELETYAQYVNGDVYGYIITDQYEEEPEDSSCWGYYGYDSALDEAKAVVDSLIESDRPSRHAQPAHKFHN